MLSSSCRINMTIVVPFHTVTAIYTGAIRLTGTVVVVYTAKTKYGNFETNIPRKGITGVSFPISTFMRLWAIYIFPRSVSLFCWRKYADRSWDYINRSKTHECWNWALGRAITRKGIHNWDFRCSVYWSYGYRIVCSVGRCAIESLAPLLAVSL